MTHSKYGFTDSEISAFSHERELRVEQPAASFAPSEKAWSLMRSPLNMRDQALTTLAKAWVESLPTALMPRALCAHYPRIVNRLALCWSDPVLTDAVMRDLLTPRRRGRQGFPDEVSRELAMLQAAALSRMSSD